jgi:hypothetical protein
MAIKRRMSGEEFRDRDEAQSCDRSLVESDKGLPASDSDAGMDIEVRGSRDEIFLMVIVKDMGESIEGHASTVRHSEAVTKNDLGGIVHFSNFLFDMKGDEVNETQFVHCKVAIAFEIYFVRED